MSLIEIINCLFQLKYLSAIAFLALAIALGTSNQTSKRISTAIAMTASGAAVATAVQNNNIQQAKQYQQEVHLLEREQLHAHYEQQEASLRTFLDIAMAEANTLKGRIAQMYEVLSDDQSEKVIIFSELEALQQEHQHVLYDLREMAIAADTLTTDLATKLIDAQALSQAEIRRVKAAARTRTAELETALADKTNLATQMLAELEAEATSTFNQFNAKVTAQSELINRLHQQIESLKSANATLTRQQLDKQIENVGTSVL